MTDFTAQNECQRRKFLEGSEGHAPQENFENQSPHKCHLLLSESLSSYIYCILNEKTKDRCPNYFRDSTRQFLILLSKICIVKILNDFRETGMDPENNGETENNRDKRPSVAIASERLVTWMHNNPNFPF